MNILAQFNFVVLFSCFRSRIQEQYAIYLQQLSVIYTFCAAYIRRSRLGLHISILRVDENTLISIEAKVELDRYCYSHVVVVVYARAQYERN